ncbi:NACHT domain-containing protein [Leucothrix pacifica]|nr:AAA family ATPase [Leucothrix pacifica]
MLELQEDNQDPISLRKIFIPLRLDIEDRDESSLNSPTKFREENEDNQLGQDAFQEITQHSFLVISGRPGAGKTTLIKALINELCGTHSSRFRNQIHKQHGAIFTIPVILRELSDVESILDFDSLLARWWARLDELNGLAFQRKTFSERLDLAKLKASLKHDSLQPLILFDGIDEVGSFDLRCKIYQIAKEAKRRGYRVILTGRPSGLADLHIAVKNGRLNRSFDETDLSQINDSLNNSPDLELLRTAEALTSRDTFQTAIDNLPNNDKKPAVANIPISPRDEEWRYIQPLTRPQIDLFIKKWYQLDPTWVSKLGTHPEEFKKALADPQRDHLLPLARRPIFLSLMAIVHCTKNEMPHGRAELYKTIVDVYLTRQRKHRRLKLTTTGDSMPQWDSHEPRTALGFLAWRSMHRDNDSNDKSDRRILWKREEMEFELQKALKTTLRFSEVTPEDAPSLISYYLNPAGLLIEPIEGYIQFAHLSFQEYLCAEYLQGQMSGRRIDELWQEKVLSHLESPGWHEVALLLLTVHANKTQNRGHFELISYLDALNYPQAKLMFCALLGKELPIQTSDRQHWFGLLVMTGLIHPKMPEIEYLREWQDLNQMGHESIPKMLEKFNDGGGESVWKYLCELGHSNSALEWKEEYFDNYSEHIEPIYKRWITPLEGESWPVQANAFEAQRFSLLSLLIKSSWGGVDPNNLNSPVNSIELQAALTEMYKKHPTFFKKDYHQEVLGSQFLFENLFNLGSNLEKEIRKSIPLSLWLPEGEYSPFLSIQFAIASKLATDEYRTRLNIAFIQLQRFLDIIASGENAHNYLKNSKKVGIGLEFIDYKNRRSSSNPRLASRNLIRAMTYLFSTMMTFTSLGKINPTLTNITSLIELSTSNLTPPFPWYKNFADSFNRLVKLQVIGNLDIEKLAIVRRNITFTGNNSTAWDWYIEQSEIPELLVNRGGRTNEPLPFELGLLTTKGLPKQIQKRENILKLQKWVDDNENWLSFVFPKETLPIETRKLLLEDIEDLKKCDWSPYAFIKAIISDWPENKKTFNCSFKASEKRLSKSIDTLFSTQSEVVDK